MHLQPKPQHIGLKDSPHSLLEVLKEYAKGNEPRQGEIWSLCTIALDLSVSVRRGLSVIAITSWSFYRSALLQLPYQTCLLTRACIVGPSICVRQR